MQVIASDQLRKISEEHIRTLAELEAQREELKSREKELKQRQALNKSEKMELETQKKMVLLLLTRSFILHEIIANSLKI